MTTDAQHNRNWQNAQKQMEAENMARESVANTHPDVRAAAEALADAHHTPWNMIDPEQQYTYCSDALLALQAANQQERARLTALRASREDRTAHWGTCSNQECLASMVIYPHADRQSDLPDEDEWDRSTFFLSCPVCGESMDWGGTDHPADIILNY